jgi:hypothetical protein
MVMTGFAVASPVTFGNSPVASDAAPAAGALVVALAAAGLVVAVVEAFELPQLTAMRATKVKVRVLRTGDEASGSALRVVLRYEMRAGMAASSGESVRIGTRKPGEFRRFWAYPRTLSHPLFIVEV